MVGFDPSTGAFSRGNALYLAHAARIAYHVDPGVEALEYLGLPVVRVFGGKLTRARGFVGTNGRWGVLAFRGTEPLVVAHWVTNLRAVQSGRGPYGGGRVHVGFHGALARRWGLVEEALAAVGDVPLFLAGHSLGGALAVLATCRLAGKANVVATYTFGSPRVGDEGFCASYTAPTYRVVNKLDLVPELPAEGMHVKLRGRVGAAVRMYSRRMKKVTHAPSYRHVKTLVRIERDGSVVVGAGGMHWTTEAVRRAIATRGKSYLEGIKDHLIDSYVAALANAECRMPNAD